MKSTEEMMEIMNGWRNGKEIQQKRLIPDGYPWVSQTIHRDGTPEWNWVDFDYRIKPEPKVIWVNECYQHVIGKVKGHMFDTPEAAWEFSVNADCSTSYKRIAVKYIEVLGDGPVSAPKKKGNGKVPDGLKRWQNERKSL